MRKTAALRVMEQCVEAREALRKEAGLGSLIGRGITAVKAAPKVFGLGATVGAGGLAAGSQIPVKAPASWLKGKIHEWTKPAPVAQAAPAGTDWAGMAKQYGPWAAGGGVLAALAYLAMNRD